ncbi:hypothetical protein PYCCODRAFT_1430085 [Trametes coccinea BRFM310]|uniref:Uncharacterized protein n=1 Tax=Trametes coccinea (strain BRFM310) TaxID=1353009 RepID=A0A1Y2J614_TRAC3|nr:hypothetical protein PYCCODRAFT_1430085 [Trametes coccinea BRFM310]
MAAAASPAHVLHTRTHLACLPSPSLLSLCPIASSLISRHCVKPSLPSIDPLLETRACCECILRYTEPPGADDIANGQRTASHPLFCTFTID